MRLTCCLLLALALPSLVLAQEAPAASLLNSLNSNINIEGEETGFDPTTGIATAKGNLRIVYGDTEIQGDSASYNSNTGDVIAQGNVTIVKAGVVYKGQLITYNVNDNNLQGDMVRSGMNHNGGNIFYAVDKLETETKYVERVDGENSIFTTHDLAMTIYPDDRIVMKGVTVYAGSTPVFWLPYLAQPLDDEIGYKFAPGFSNNWGAYLLNQYGVMHGDHTLAQYKLDLRSARGVAGGVDLISMKQRTNQHWGKLKLYYANDSDPKLNRANQLRTDDVDSERYRINFQHRIYITGPAERTWYLDFDINKMSDQYFYEDFFFEEFRSDREPDNHVSLVRSDPRYVVSLIGKFQLNDFYRTDTRLPELAIDFTRQPIFNSGLYYQGNSSYGILDEKRGSAETKLTKELIGAAGDFLDGANVPKSSLGGLRRSLGVDPETNLTEDDVTLALAALQAQTGDSSYNRFHSYHEVLMPKTLFGWLNLVPRAGVGYQHYSGIDGGAKELDSEGRPLVQLGMDVSFKLSKTWDDMKNDRLGLDGLKHTVQPYINYSYLNADSIDGLPAIDRNVPTTRPRPLDLPFYTGIDSLSSWNVARVGVRNLFQTRRDYTSNDSEDERQFRSASDSNVQTYNWAGLNTYVDYFVKDPEFNRDTSNLYNELFWRPMSWMTFWADTQLPIGGSSIDFTEVNYGATFMPSKSLSVTLGHQVLSDHPFFESSSLVYSRIYARVNENWGFSMNHVYELDDGTIEYQSYALHRDLSSWVASLGALVRDNRGATDFGMIFSLTLKDFPQVSIPLDTDPNPTGRGGRR
jgi:LPS-assembly protein